MNKKRFVISVILFLVMYGCSLQMATKENYAVQTGPRAIGTVYYVDSVAGDDANTGTSDTNAWKSLAKVNSTEFNPGDEILLKAGSVWNEQLWPKGSGISGSPIIIDMYGTGNKPIINGQGTTYPASASGAVMLYNQEYWEINNLEVTNYNSSVTSTRAGILVYNCESDLKNHIYIKDCYVHDVNSDTNGGKLSGGIILFGNYVDKDGNSTVGIEAGFNDVLVENNHVKNVVKEGIRNKSDAGYAWPNYPRINTNIVFRNNFVEDIFGDGMVLSEVLEGALAEYNTIKNHCNTASSYYAGLWTHITTGAIIQFNEVYGGEYGNTDGEAFDTDNNCDGDIFQYNYSHDNKGGFLLTMPTAKNLIFRYNISENDGARDKETFRLLTDSNDNMQIYNNTVYVSPTIPLNNIIYTAGRTIGPKFYNNIIHAEGSVSKFSSHGLWKSSADFKNNLLFPATLDDINGPVSHAGLVTQDPKLVDPGNAGIGIENAIKYKLLETSPAINAGISISNNGGRDFFNNSLYSGSPDIGAHEYELSIPEPTSVTWNPTDDAYVRDGNYANDNFGTSSVLRVKSDASSYARKAYTKFNFNTYSGTSSISAKLRLYSAFTGTDTTRTIKIYGTVDESWTETGITWNNAPTASTYIGSLDISDVTGQWYEIDITNYIINNMSDKVVSFLLINEAVSSSQNHVDFASKEAAIGTPELVIEESAPVSITVNPTEDAHVRNGSYADDNFGTSSVLRVKSDATSYARKAYTKFNFNTYSGTSSISAKLRLYSAFTGTDTTRTIKIYGTVDESWVETGITWNNAPAGSTYIGAIEISDATGVWYEVDVTSYINSNMSDKIVSFLLINDSSASAQNHVDFASKESAIGSPELRIE